MRLAAIPLALAACGPTDAPRAQRPGGGDPAGSEPGAGARLDPTEKVLLDEHNRYRAAHCAPPLTWSDELARVAQAWANHLRDHGCGFDHSRNPYGENLAKGTSGALPPEVVVEMWYREVDAYDFRRGGFALDTGHFTQLVWKETTELGCGTASCRGFDLWVCNYAPYGNVEGGYRDNVRPTSCK